MEGRGQGSWGVYSSPAPSKHPEYAGIERWNRACEGIGASSAPHRGRMDRSGTGREREGPIHVCARSQTRACTSPLADRARLGCTTSAPRYMYSHTHAHAHTHTHTHTHTRTHTHTHAHTHNETACTSPLADIARLGCVYSALTLYVARLGYMPAVTRSRGAFIHTDIARLGYTFRDGPRSRGHVAHSYTPI
jgi:hypothetical protein